MPKYFPTLFSTTCDRIWKIRLPHTQYQTYDFARNGLLAQYTIIFHCAPCSKVTSLVSVAAFLRPCVSLEWYFDAYRWPCMALLYWCLDGWPMSFIFNLVCCEHKRGPVGLQTGFMAFNCLRIPFCTPTLIPHPPPLLLPLAISLPSHKKLLETGWILGPWKLFTHTIIAKVLAVIFISSAGSYNTIITWNRYIL